MKVFVRALLVGSVVITAGCATGLNSTQDREYSAMSRDGVLVEEKTPTAGAWLGLLPGGGSFYARSYGFGVANLLLWPISILWDPVSGYDGSKTINYDVTKHALRKKERDEEDALDGARASGEVNEKEYFLARQKLRSKFDYE
jgi:hypothetical protein